jgi:DNA polymerase elongation subunit (family B)
VHAGQAVHYLILNAKARHSSDRVIVAQMLKPNTHYDVEEYLKLLLSAGETLLGVFGYTKGRIQAEALDHEKQTMIMQRWQLILFLRSLIVSVSAPLVYRCHL